MRAEKVVKERERICSKGGVSYERENDWMRG